ncbi:MAG: activator of (R)-2-hydroxyglutaryl-CoA dehydratase [Planctomycetes bacterium]|nr:activator of (R)-2-hydroxyglutaryl-CoA dehydratase [Planctomycetota bacterium]
MSASTLSLPLIDEQIETERRRLLEEAGISTEPSRRFTRTVERPFTKAERGHVTLLLGGLTVRHDQLIMAGLEGLGYNIDLIPVPKKADFQSGKEYGNNGQCNPTYFTVGALVNYLKRLRDEGQIPVDDILDHYVFVTAGACGPCRFGMYEAEFRLALRNSGFDGFRVLLFQQSGGLSQTEVEAGLEMNLNFFLSLVNAMFMGDLLNEVAYHIRPYEVEPGRTNEVLTRCVEYCGNMLREKDYDSIHGGALAKIISKLAPVKNADEAQIFLDQLRGDYYTKAFEKCSRMIEEEIEVDYTRSKPICKVTGEFWAQTTEGDGNFNMFAFLEKEGAEVLVEPIGTWIAYMLNQARNQLKDSKGLSEGEDLPGRWDVRKKWEIEKTFRKKLAMFGAADKIINREYERLRGALGGTAHALVNQNELVRLGHPYYNAKSGGGEGHLEVAKNIYYCNKELAHMVLSLKPFGCMPSAQSDGAQAAVISNFKDMIFLPIETSGEGDINAHSRVQMALGEAKFKCKAEFKEAVARTGYTIDQIRKYVATHRELRRPLQHVAKQKGIISKAGNFVIQVGKLMDTDSECANLKVVAGNAKQELAEVGV